MSAAQVAELTIDGVDVPWFILAIAGREALHAPFSFDVTCRPDLASAGEDLAGSLLTRSATLAWPLESGEMRTTHALVDGVERRGRSWMIRLVPTVATLADTVDHRVFLDLDAIAIVKEVLSGHGLSAEVRCSRTLPRRDQCVQAFEADLAFISRILADEGVVWFCHPTETDRLVLVDNPSGFAPTAGDPLPIRESGGLVTGTSVYSVGLHRRVVSDKVSLRDHNFKAPAADLSVDAKEGQGRLERYEYRGHYTTKAVGEALAGMRLEEARARRLTLTGETTCRGLSAGEVVTLEGGSAGMAGKWLITTVEHAVHEHDAAMATRWYVAKFEAVPGDAAFRPARPRPAKLGGVQTMDVTGPGGSEIHTEALGQIKAHLRWDRRKQKDDTSSAWFRVTQPPTSGGFFLPRVGWEVLTSFWGASGDVPLEIGRLYNGVAPPPSGLPGLKVVSSFGTRTSPGGAGGNLVSFNDTKGAEGMTFNASKDFNERTENDKVTRVKVDDTHSVGSSRKLNVGQVHAVKVGGAQKYSIGASRTENVGANKVINAASESVTIGAARIFNVGGDLTTQCAALSRLVGAAKMEACIEHQSVLVSGASSVVIGSSWGQLSGISAALHVGGVSKEEVGGAKSIKALKYGLTVRGSLKETYASRDVDAGGAINEVFATTATYDIGGSATMKGADVIFSATEKITLKADGITITIAPGEVKIEGKFESDQASADKDDEDYD